MIKNKDSYSLLPKTRAFPRAESRNMCSLVYNELMRNFTVSFMKKVISGSYHLYTPIRSFFFLCFDKILNMFTYPNNLLLILHK